VIDRLLVSHRTGIIIYMHFLQGITKAPFQILTEISIIFSFYIGQCSWS